MQKRATDPADRGTDFVFLFVGLCVCFSIVSRALVAQSKSAISLIKDTDVTLCDCSSYLRSKIQISRVIRPTQSIMYVTLQVNTSQKYILLGVQYKYLKSCSGDFYSPESDPPHKIMRYRVYYSTQLSFWFPPDRICQAEMICIGSVPVLKRHFGGAGP